VPRSPRSSLIQLPRESTSAWHRRQRSGHRKQQLEFFRGQRSGAGEHVRRVPSRLVPQRQGQPSKIVSHRIQMDDAPDACDKFDKCIEGYTQILMRVSRSASSKIEGEF